ncbi:MAG: cytochrome c oxidase subunit I [Burkholderiales bacterium]|nr:cytochrome c oxidase subunit I [Burkholderiales bacterium]
MSDARRSEKTNWIILLIGAVAAFPLIGSYVLYLFWKPDEFVNYGELIRPVPLARGSAPAGFEAVRGKWTFLMFDSGACDAYCQRKLYIMRQVRLTQGEDMNRVERVWIVDDAHEPAAQLRNDYKGTHMLPAGADLATGLAPAGAARDHIYLVDPLGNVMMRYPRDPDPSLIKKDLRRLLKSSRAG